MKIVVVRPIENFRGRTYGEWAAMWWKWLVSDQPDDYSINDPIVFLRANIDYEFVGNGKARVNSTKHYDRTGDKKITISEDTAIFFPVIEAEYNQGDPHPEDESKVIETEHEMRYFARRENDNSGPMAAIIRLGDDKPEKLVGDIKEYRAESPLFILEVSNKNPLKDKMEVIQPPGTYCAVTDGYWILIKSLPLSDKKYQIHFEAQGRGTFYAATYDIVVKARQKSEVKDISDLIIRDSTL